MFEWTCCVPPSARPIWIDCQHVEYADQANVRLILVKRESPNRCVFEHWQALASHCFGIALTLSSHRGKAVVLLQHEAFSDAAVTNVPLGIGLADGAVRVHFDGTCIVRAADGKTMCPFNVSYHEGNTLVMGSGRTKRTQKAVTVNDDGTISPACNPELVLGVETQGLPLSGSWISMKDGFQVLSIHHGVGCSTDGFMAKLTQHAEGFIFLEYEWGETFWYKFNEDGNLEQTNGFVAWKRAVNRANSILSLEGRVNCFRRGSKLANLISTGAIAVLKSAYLEDCLTNASPYQRRQQIPHHYIWDGEEAVDLWQQHGRMFLVIVSYGWLSATHPDPHCYHLWRLVGVLSRLKGYFRRYGVQEIGVIIDYCALWQPEREGPDGAATDSRTEEQKKEFKLGLGSFTDFYIHQHVTALKMMGMPKGTERGYEERGWTLCESILIDSKSGVGNRLAFDEGFDPELEDSTGYGFLHKYGNQRCDPPVTPEMFEERLLERRDKVHAKGIELFVVKGDHDIVPAMYRSSFEFMQNAATLSYLHSNWDDSDIATLAAVLRAAKTEKLSLNKNRMTDKGLKLLGDALVSVGMIRRLRLDYNQVGPDGALYLCSILEQLPSLISLSLGGNPMCENEEAVVELLVAWEQAGKDALQLDLGIGNQYRTNTTTHSFC